MIIVDKIKTPSPKWVPQKPVPTFKNGLEKARYWEEEKKRWREGWGDGYSHINGIQYFMLTTGTYKDGSDGTLIQPRYRDCDEWITDELYDSFWGLKNHLFVFKRREIGLTSIGAGVLPAYTMRMFPSSTFGMTSCDKDRLYKAYNDKTDIYMKHLHGDISPIFDKSIGYRENSTKQQLYAKLPFLSKNLHGDAAIEFADLFAKETSESDKAAAGFSGTRMRAAFIDELPLHLRRKTLLNSMQSCFMKGAEQSGIMLAGGTAEDSITSEQISELQDLVEKSEFFKFKTIFVPAWWGLFVDENGVSDEKRGTEWVMKERERLDKIDDKSYLKAFIKNYPLTMSEIFNMGGGKGWDEYTVDKLNFQNETLVKETENKPAPYKIFVTKEDVICNPTKESTLNILEHPRPGVKYVIGVDGIMTSDLSQSGEDEPSKFAAVVMKGHDPMELYQFAPVAIYCERPKTIEEANMRTVDLLKYYNKYDNCKIIGELNAGGEHLLKMVINEGLKNTVMYRKDFSKKGFVDTKKPWFTRNVQIKDWQFEAANVYFKKYYDQIRFRQIILDALKPIDKNTDVLDALEACLYGWGSGDLLNEKAPKKEQKKKVWIMTSDSAGKPVWKEEEF